MNVISKIGNGLRTFAGDVAQGFFEIAHNGFAMMGLVLAFVSLTLIAKPELRVQSETALMGWLQARQLNELYAQAVKGRASVGHSQPPRPRESNRPPAE